jgi:Aldehyde dehydrogenase family
LPLDTFGDDEGALDYIHSASFALGASIFSRDITRARTLAARIKSGFVLINDLIVPTADPRMPFGGVKASGFGSTRGNEGLLEMTFPHVVAVNRGNSHRHFDETGADDPRLFSSYIRAAHGRGRERFGAIVDLVRELIDAIKRRKANS